MIYIRHLAVYRGDLYTLGVCGVALVTLVLVNRVLVARLEKRGDSE